MDSLADGKRHLLLASVDTAMKWGKTQRASQEHGLMSLFGEMEDASSAIEFRLKTDAEELDRNQLLQWEKELIGVYISKHPLAYLGDLLKAKTTHTTAQINEELERKEVTLGGTITEVRRLTTRKGDTMCVVQLEDMYGSIGVTVFPRLYGDTGDLWAENMVVIVRGEVQVRRDEPGILCNYVEAVEGIQEEMNRKQYHVNIRLKVSGSDEKSVSDDVIRVQDIWNCIREQPGRDHYSIVVANGEWEAVLAPGTDTLHYERVRDKLNEIVGDKGTVQAELLER